MYRFRHKERFVKRPRLVTDANGVAEMYVRALVCSVRRVCTAVGLGRVGVSLCGCLGTLML